MRRAALALLLALPGCAITHGPGAEWGVYPVSKAGEEVQTLTLSNVGIKIIGSSNTANGMPEIDIGYQRAQFTRVPAWPRDRVVPSVTATSTVDATTGARIAESLEVGTYTDEAELPAATINVAPLRPPAGPP